MTITAAQSRQRSIDILSECCQRGRAARLIFPNQGILQSGKIFSVDDQHIVVRITNADDMPAVTDDLCCVIFDYQNRPQVFLSAIVEVVGDACRNVTIAIPEEIAAAERRHVVRF